MALLDSDTRRTLGRRHWRQSPLTRPALTLALAAVVLLHVLFALVLWYEMQPKLPRWAVAHRDKALIVRLIAGSDALPAPPPPLLVPPPVRTTTHEKPRRDAMIVQDHPAPPAPTAATPPAPGLFAKDGSVRLPSMPSTPAPVARTQAKPAEPADDRRILQHDSNRMHYKATRFEKYFPPPNETAGGAVGRHIGDAIKQITKSICDPKKPSTASDLLCGAPPLPPSSKDRDERLNLPPPSLTGDDPNPVKVPPLSSCIAAYKAGKPLAYGCPVNTPDLAFKAEMRECTDLYRAGKRLKTWCPRDTPERAAAEAATPAPSSRPGSH